MSLKTCLCLLQDLLPKRLLLSKLYSRALALGGV